MHQKYPEVVKLRKLGKSYREIAGAVNISKNSVSRWCKELKLSPRALKILENKSNYPKEKFIEYNRQKSQKVKEENQKIREDNLLKIKPISNYELLLIGAALYWGEGCKRHSRGESSCYVSLVNSDPDLIKVFLRFVRKILCIPEDMIKPRIHIHPNITKESAVNFWSKMIDIPKNKFYFTTQVSKASRGKRPKNSLPFGTLEIRISNRKRFFEILGLIDGLIKQAL